MVDDDIRRDFISTCSQLIKKMNDIIQNEPLTISSSHLISHKTISEIGGRILEEFISNAVKDSFKDIEKYTVEHLSSRSLGDFCIQTKNKNPNRFYFDIKSQHLSIREKTHEYYIANGIDQKKPGESHPNLISYQKAVDFYGDRTKERDDIGLIFVKYDPIITGKSINFKISSFDHTSIFLLRDIDIDNLSYGNLGKGQIQLSRINNIKITAGSKLEFIEKLNFLKNRPRKVRKSPKL